MADIANKIEMPIAIREWSRQVIATFQSRFRLNNLHFQDIYRKLVRGVMDCGEYRQAA
jgi:hypothetical protein